MKRKFICFSIVSLLLTTSLVVTPTVAKYIHSHSDVAGILGFTPLIPTSAFVIDNQDFIDENGNVLTEVKSESKWGAENNPGSNQEENEDKYGLDSLDNILISVSNKSSKRLLVTFYIELFYEGLFNWGSTIKSTNFSIVITNITKDNSQHSGSYKYIDSDQNGNIFSKTINPTDTNIFPNVTQQTIENLFVLEPSEYFDFNIDITGEGSTWADFADIFSTNYYYSFHMVVIEYNS